MPSNYRNQLFRNYDKTHAAYVDDDVSKLMWFKEYAIVNYLPHMHKKGKISAKILEIGCNKGYLIKALGDLGFDQLFGIDLSPDDVEKAKNLNPQFTIACTDAFVYLENKLNKFDVIVLKAVLEHVPKNEIMPLLEKINASLNLGGVIIVDVPNMDWLFASHERYMDFTHEAGFTRESLAQVMRNIFVDVSVFQGKEAFVTHNIRSKIRVLLRSVTILFLNCIFRMIGEGASDVWWSSRSIIAVGNKY